MFARLRRSILNKFSVRFYERAIFFPLYNSVFSSIAKTPSFATREPLWEKLFSDHIGEDSKLLYLEFGVWKGDSIKHNCKLNSNPESRFIGFDTFEGLPEQWQKETPAGHFSVGGAMPQVDDNRVSFEKGLFSDTLLPKLDSLDLDKFEKIVVHFDADLYSSTLYCLMELKEYFPSYYFIYDEFLQDEGRALYNFQQAYPSKIAFYGHRPDTAGYCTQVTGHIEHS